MEKKRSFTLSSVFSSMEADDEGREDEGPFFDLEFALPDAGSDGSGGGENIQFEDGEENKDFNFSLEDELRAISPSDDMFFNGRLIPAEEKSLVITGADNDPKLQPVVSLLKSATRFRVFILGLRKNKSPAAEPNASGASPKQSQTASKFFFVKFKVEEVPIVSLFTRDGSSRNLIGSPKDPPEVEAREDAAIVPPAADEKKPNSKEVVHKYLSKIKPLYVRVSKRYADKLKFSGPLVHDDVPTTELSSTEENEGEETEEEMREKMADKSRKLPMPARLRVVYERLGKSRSVAVAAVTSPQRRDDSLLQQQDGIQSAIAHCKRSFTSTSKGSSLLRSKSDPRASCL